MRSSSGFQPWLGVPARTLSLFWKPASPNCGARFSFKVQEFMATGLLVTLCLMVIEQIGFLSGDLPSLWASQSALYACCTQTLVILALGGPTGPGEH